jgi:hypothetical protein
LPAEEADLRYLNAKNMKNEKYPAILSVNNEEEVFKK